MTQTDKLAHFRAKCEEIGQAAVAKAIGKSAGAVSQVYHDKYGADTSLFLERYWEVFGGQNVTCPVLGEITLTKCAFHRRREFARTNHVRVALFRTCPNCTPPLSPPESGGVKGGVSGNGGGA